MVFLPMVIAAALVTTLTLLDGQLSLRAVVGVTVVTGLVALMRRHATPPSDPDDRWDGSDHPVYR